MGPRGITCGRPSIVSIYFCPQQTRHDGAQEHIYRHDSVTGSWKEIRVRPTLRLIRHLDFSMYNNCFFENWYQRSRDRDFHWIVQFSDFVKGFTERPTGKKVQDPVLSCFENSRWISREISGLHIICIFCSLRFSVISHVPCINKLGIHVWCCCSV